MRLVFGYDAAVSEWVWQQLKYKGLPKDVRAIGVEDKGDLICGVTYRNYNGHDVQMDIAATNPRWCSRGNLFAFFYYPFEDLGCARVTGHQAADNERAHRLVTRLGFVKEGVLRKAADGSQDLWVYGLLKSECKWIGKGAN